MPAAINLGPLSLPLSVLVPMVAVFLGLWLGNRQVKRQGTAPVEPFFWRIVFWALAVARLAYVLRHHEAYLEDPWTALDVRDGGFDPWAGLVWAWLLAWRYGWRGSAPRRPLMAAMVGMTVIGVAGLLALQNAATRVQPLPALQLQTLEGQAVPLQRFGNGRPAIVNLWATWCPHCVREMPVLAEAQRQYPDLDIVFLDQGEDGARVSRFLQRRGLALDNVLLDAKGEVGRHFGLRALPATLFYGRDGSLQDIRIGALSKATLQERIERLRR